MSRTVAGSMPWASSAASDGDDAGGNPSVATVSPASPWSLSSWSNRGSRTGEGPRLLARGHGVDEDQGVVAVEQLVGQVHPADAEVGDAHALGHLLGDQAAGHLRTEAVVGQEDVADPGHQDVALTVRLRRRRPRRGWLRRRWLRHRRPRPRRAGSRGSGRTTRASRRPGRRRRTTARCTSPSTSLNTPVTVAQRPATNMSWASARRDGARRTLLPVPIALPPTSTTSVPRVEPGVDAGVPPWQRRAGRVPAGRSPPAASRRPAPRRNGLLGRHRAKGADRTVQARGRPRACRHSGR